MPRDTITAINNVAKELQEIKNVLSELNATMKEFINKFIEFVSILFFFVIIVIQATHHIQTLANSSSIWLKCLGI